MSQKKFDIGEIKYATSIISEKLWQQELMNRFLKQSAIGAVFQTEPLPPLSRTVRWKRKALSYSERIKLAYRVLRGDDIYEDCG
jgi:hypothetical protein